MMLPAACDVRYWHGRTLSAVRQVRHCVAYDATGLVRSAVLTWGMILQSILMDKETEKDASLQ
eukprot:2513356-Rhodomonas_salina.1